METKECLICNQDADFHNPSVETDSKGREIFKWGFLCNRCGRYIYTQEMKLALMAAKPKHILSSVISELTRKYDKDNAEGRFVEIFSEEDLNHLLKSPLIPTKVVDKAYKLLLFFRDITEKPGQGFNFKAEDSAIQTASYAEDAEEAAFYLRYIWENGWIEGLDTRSNSTLFSLNGLKVTIPGFAEIESHEQHRKLFSQAFVAMAFKPQEEMNNLFDEYISPAVSSRGYLPLRIDRKEHNEKICDEIIIEIRKSKF
jgi:hypothetical protein